jgi:pyruvate/2-oxoacid:ferredoxin oxidoreductase beta subunit/Pyruvate/2-oxoacid:ferredoxin oxidoreductase gamma subunit
MSTITITPIATFRTDDPYPFCPGCGHGPILDRLNEAMLELDLDPAKVVIVSDIGCSGLSDQYFTTSAFHGLHGRSITYATGIKLANPNLEVVVIMGDGGTGIGGAHLLSAARRNIGITVIVMNNLNFGMTGGQHSTTTPEGGVTSTTPYGHLEHPLDICATVGVNGAAYVYRGSSFDTDLADRFVAAMTTPGFALLDVWDLCTAYYVRSNKFTRAGMEESMRSWGMEPGLLYERDVTEYATGYRAAHDSITGSALAGARPVPVGYKHALDRPMSLVVAGSAGGKVRSAARLVALGGLRSGLWAAQRDDYPVTVKSGHSVTELWIAPEEMPLATVVSPDVFAVISADGFAKAGPYLSAMRSDGLVLTIPDYADVVTDAQVVVIDPKAAPQRIPKTSLGLVFLSAALALTSPYPTDALREAAGSGSFAEVNLEAVETGIGLASG